MMATRPRRETFWRRETAVVAAVCAAMIFVQAVVFAAQGLLLFAAASELGWSGSQAGAGFTAVILGAGAGAMMPILSIPRIGASGTLITGLGIVCGAFLILSVTKGLGALYCAMFLAGIGFSLAANTCGIYLISGWAGSRASRTIGIYMMIGMLGNAVAPPTAQTLISDVGWRGYALEVAVMAGVMAAVCALCLREPPSERSVANDEGWLTGIGRVLRSPVFLLLATAIVATQTAIVTVTSVAPAHLANMGLSNAVAARELSLFGISAMVVTGLASFISHIVRPRQLIIVSLLLTAGGMAIFAITAWVPGLHLFAVLLGAGTGGATLAVTWALVEQFGAEEGSASLGAVWTLAVLAAVGPWIAGLVADATGSYAPALAGIGVLMLPIALACLWLPRTVR